ncbi:MAG: thioredoxin family protein [Firmicutes bacterium]|jgi:glutaredoxin|uniref:Thioredoxin n=1 Tax=Sulfobacillus benefaciens TaxID=453960 RepID=A0A2T2WRG4_9FIRM|nr:thioredoxin family protein [Bacillota bacterium]MCL5014721.1 thioredoxin family protein [Bacillota bacterium]PSR24803.1 MAG: thioredoxin [Sulfobacillus benefaciens]HBQ94921.1 thioredoxin [Sulfobacillus sp.]
MGEVIVATSPWCQTCPATIRQWKQLGQEYGFTVREVDVGTLEGRELAVKLYIRSVPSTIINNQVVHVGVIDRPTALELLKKYNIIATPR